MLYLHFSDETKVYKILPLLRQHFPEYKKLLHQHFVDHISSNCQVNMPPSDKFATVQI